MMSGPGPPHQTYSFASNQWQVELLNAWARAESSGGDGSFGALCSQIAATLSLPVLVNSIMALRPGLKTPAGVVRLLDLLGGPANSSFPMAMLPDLLLGLRVDWSIFNADDLAEMMTVLMLFGKVLPSVTQFVHALKDLPLRKDAEHLGSPQWQVVLEQDAYACPFTPPVQPSLLLQAQGAPEHVGSMVATVLLQGGRPLLAPYDVAVIIQVSRWKLQPLGQCRSRIMRSAGQRPLSSLLFLLDVTPSTLWADPKFCGKFVLTTPT
jgi:hypothetical protein